jgi:hypothetical protein
MQFHTKDPHGSRDELTGGCETFDTVLRYSSFPWVLVYLGCHVAVVLNFWTIILSKFLPTGDAVVVVPAERRSNCCISALKVSTEMRPIR